MFAGHRYLLVGQALLTRGSLHVPPGSEGADAAKASAALSIGRTTLATAEAPIEQAVSRDIPNQFCWGHADIGRRLTAASLAARESNRDSCRGLPVLGFVLQLLFVANHKPWKSWSKIAG
jgi:hypothetical protein